MADVGARCVVGAGSVVTEALPDGTVAVGAPARPVGRRGGEGERA
jgi:acetyltransferase-like isoleucine patch superfamily enzyme